MPVLEITTRGTTVAVRGGLFAIGDRRLHPEDVDMVIAEVPAVTITGDALALMGRAGIELVICDDRRMPVSALVPATGGTGVTARTMRLQAALTPRRRRALWRQIVRAKISGQASFAGEFAGPVATRLARLAAQVEHGDPANVEAQAARLYWPAVFGAEFRRHAADDANAMLNFGYAVLRAIVCRKLHAAGLHRSIGIHHDNSENGGNLADDLIEPFRPAVDRLTFGLVAKGAAMDRDARATLARTGDWPVLWGTEWVRLATAVERLARSLRQAVEGAPARLDLPHCIGSEKDAGRMAKDVGAGAL